MGDRTALDAALTAGNALYANLEDVRRERDEARAEVERLRAAVNTPTIAHRCTSGWRLYPAVACSTCRGGREIEGSEIADELSRMEAENAALRARPTVHPLAWLRLQASRLVNTATSTDECERRMALMMEQDDLWADEEWPLTATGGEVLAPDEGGDRE